MDPHRRRLGFRADGDIRGTGKTANVEPVRLVVNSEQPKVNRNAFQVRRSFVCVAETPTGPQGHESVPPPSRQTHGPGALTWLLVAAALIRLVCARQCSELGTQSLAFAASTTVLATVWKRKQQVLNMPWEHHTALCYSIVICQKTGWLFHLTANFQGM